MMVQSETMGALACALSRAQGELEDAGRTRQAEKYKYADLGSVLAIIRPVFSKYGLCVIQSIGRSENEISVTTLLAHESGEWVEGTVHAPIIIPVSKSGYPTMTDIQATGSITTYLRRYSLAAICGITQVDDDGAMKGDDSSKHTYERATGSQSSPVQASTATQVAAQPAKPEETPAAVAVKPPMVSAETKARLISAAKAVFGSGANDSLRRISQAIGVPSSSAELTESQARQLILEIERAAQ